MLEFPEAQVVAGQVREVLQGKRITHVVAGQTNHKFAWYHGDPQNYPALLNGKTITGACGYGGMVEILAGYAYMVFSDGVNLRYHRCGEKRPAKHQLLIEFEDDSAFSASVQMYGGLLCCPEGKELDNPYYNAAREKPSPLTAEFNPTYFEQMINAAEVQKLSAKAFLATEQRIPGLGNGVLQDILYNAGIHPKKKVRELPPEERAALFHTLKDTLAEMTAAGGRDTEKDLFARPGGYKTKLSKNTAGQKCLQCNGIIKKENYLGGSIYYCDGCQKY